MEPFPPDDSTKNGLINGMSSNAPVKPTVTFQQFNCNGTSSVTQNNQDSNGSNTNNNNNIQNNGQYTNSHHSNGNSNTMESPRTRSTYLSPGRNWNNNNNNANNMNVNPSSSTNNNQLIINMHANGKSGSVVKCRPLSAMANMSRGMASHSEKMQIEELKREIREIARNIPAPPRGGRNADNQRCGNESDTEEVLKRFVYTNDAGQVCILLWRVFVACMYVYV
jgi:hypothetical protein